VTLSIQFLGAAGCVTGSQFLVTVGGRRVLVDCGMFQGSPEETERNRMPFAFEPETIDALLLTHAHLDHCGRIPALTKAGFRGPIHATKATADLAEIVLRDAAKLQVEFAERWNRHHRKEVEEAAADVDRRRWRPRRRRMTRRSRSGSVTRRPKGGRRPALPSMTTKTSTEPWSSFTAATTTTKSP